MFVAEFLHEYIRLSHPYVALLLRLQRFFCPDLVFNVFEHLEGNLAAPDKLAHGLVEHGRKGNTQSLSRLLRGLLELLVGLEHDCSLHIPEYISWYNSVKPDKASPCCNKKTKNKRVPYSARFRFSASLSNQVSISSTSRSRPTWSCPRSLLCSLTPQRSSCPGGSALVSSPASAD